MLSPGLKARTYLLGIAIAVALTMRLTFVFFEATNWWATDTYLYADQAKEILEGNWPNAAPNGYPLLVAGLMALFGEQWDLAGVLLNVLFSTVIVAIVYALALDRSDSAPVAFLAAMVAALWPSQLVWVRVLYTEVPAAFFLCCGLFLHWRKYDVLGAVFLGAALLTRPTLTPVVAVLGLALVITRQWWRAAAMTMIPVLFLAAAQLPKATPVPGNNGSFLAKNIILSNYEIGSASRDAFEYRGESVSDAIRIYFALLANDPVKFAKLRLGHLSELWGPWPDRMNGRSDGTPRSIVRNAMLGLQFPLFLLAIAAFIRKPDYLGLVLICPAFVITAIHTGLFAILRYNYPAIPFLIVLASSMVAVVAKRSNVPAADTPVAQLQRSR